MDRTVIVSGGGTGIGRAVAERFGRDGARVVLIGRREDVIQKTATELGGDRITAIAADLSEPDEAARVRERIAADHGRVDVVVNSAGGNAALASPPEPLAGAALAAWHWDSNFRSNVLTAVLLTEELKGLLGDGGRVVLVSSIAAFRGSGSGSYAGSKAALHPYAFDLAAELGPRGVTVNVVAPGYIKDTEFFPGGGVSAEREQVLIGQTAVGRAGVPADVAETVHWLASPGAAHVTGQIVQVNGGALYGR